MKRIIKRTVATNVLLICLICTLGIFKVNAEENSFVGYRTIEFKAEYSDLENFINGGKSAFDFVLRKNAPAWLNYQLKTIGRDSYLKFSFEFISYDDYCSKLKELLRYSPSIVWVEEDGVSLIENCNSFEFLNFLNEELLSSSCLLEKTTKELFTTITIDKISLNDTEYEVHNRVDIHPKTKDVIKFDVVDVSTIGKNDGTYERKITLEMKSSLNQDFVEEICDRFQKVAKVTQEQISDSRIKVAAEYKAYSYEDLIKKTMVCLNAATSILETEEYVDDMKVKVKRVEFFDLSSLLEKEGKFTYSYEFPSYYQNVVSEQDSNVNVDEVCVSSENESYTEFTYERGFQFDEIEVYSDFSDWFGKKTRSIKLNKNMQTAQLYHDLIKTELSSKLQKGMRLDIYDMEGKRYYEILYLSYFLKELGNNTGILFDSVCRLDREESWIPFGSSILKENIMINKIIPNMSPAKETVVSYKLFPLSKIQEIKKDTVKIEEDLVTYREGNSVHININYRTLNMLKSIIEVFAFGIVIGSAVIICIKVKKIIIKNRQSQIGEIVNVEKGVCMKQEEKEIKIERLCPQCGSAIVSEAKFCGKCGSKLENMN